MPFDDESSLDDLRDSDLGGPRYEGAAPHYASGRLPYPAGLTEAMRGALGLDGSGRLLDIGCGPGSVTLRLAGLFDQVVGMDADAGMIDAARAAAGAVGVSNVRWLVGPAEALDGEAGSALG